MNLDDFMAPYKRYFERINQEVESVVSSKVTEPPKVPEASAKSNLTLLWVGLGVVGAVVASRYFKRGR